MWKLSFTRHIAITIAIFFVIGASLACQSFVGGSENPETLQSTQVSSGIITPIVDNLEEISTPFSTSSDNADTFVEFYANNITLSTSDNGWVDWEVQFAVRNKQVVPIYFGTAFSGDNPDIRQYYYGGYSPDLDFVNIETDGSYVNTSEGEIYPATIQNISVILIPSTQTLTRLINVSYRVPELLNPKELIIEPGISINNNDPNTTTINLEKEPNSGKVKSPEVPITDLPVEFELNEFVNFRIEQQDLVDLDYKRNTLPLRTQVTLENKDITGNQSYEIDILLVDQYGNIYQPGCDKLPGTIGPGQTETHIICFSINGPATLGENDYFLSLINDNIEINAKINKPIPTNCIPPSELPTQIYGGYNKFDVARDELLTLPITTSGSIQASGTYESSYGPIDRIRFEGKDGQVIQIDFDGDPVENNTGWAVILTDPAGNEFFSAWIDRSSGYWIFPFPDLPMHTFERIPLHCSGIYNLYILGPVRGMEGSRNYQIGISVIENTNSNQ